LLCVSNREANNCIRYRSGGLCADYPPCSKETGEGCPSGHRCYDSCCPEGICEIDCTQGSAPRAPRIARSVATGPRPYLE
jgi:hypothetical protein